MSKIFILGDLHFGVRQNSIDWHDMQFDYLENVFLPYLEKHAKHGDYLVQVGDVFDNRQSLNLKIIDSAVKLFEKFAKILPVYIICGNHDIYYKSSNAITSLDVFKNINNVFIYKEPEIVQMGHRNVLMMPWRTCNKHMKDSLKKFKSVDLMFCHTDVVGSVTDLSEYEVNTLDDFKKIKFTYSGHIHIRQELKNFIFVGTPYALTRNDIGNIKGFYICNLEDLSYEFIENTHSPTFLKLQFTEKYYNVDLESFKDLIKNKYVDLYVTSNYINSKLSKFLKEVSHSAKKIEIFTKSETTTYDTSTIKELNDYSLDMMYKKYVEENQDISKEDKSKVIKILDEQYKLVAE